MAFEVQGASDATHVMVVPDVPHVPLSIQPTSVAASVSAVAHVDPAGGDVAVHAAVLDATMPARAAVGRRLRDRRLGREDQAVGDDAVEQGDQEDDDERELDHLGAALVVADVSCARSFRTLHVRGPNVDPLFCISGTRGNC